MKDNTMNLLMRIRFSISRIRGVKGLRIRGLRSSL